MVLAAVHYLCIIEDDVMFGFLREENEYLPSGGIFDVKQNRRMGFVKNNFQRRKN
jgi:hypothetical protein